MSTFLGAPQSTRAQTSHVRPWILSRSNVPLIAELLSTDMFSATAIANFLACQHIATLDRAEERKEVTKPFFNDPTIDLLRKLGLGHERQYLRQMAENDRLTVVQIDTNSSWEAAAAE